MKLSTILFLFLFVSNIVGMLRKKNPRNTGDGDSSQRGNEQVEEQQNITETRDADIGQSNPETEADSNIHSSQEEIPVVASESPQQKVIKELLAILDGMEDGKLKGKMVYLLLDFYLYFKRAF